MTIKLPAIQQGVIQAIESILIFGLLAGLTAILPALLQDGPINWNRVFSLFGFAATFAILNGLSTTVKQWNAPLGTIIQADVQAAQSHYPLDGARGPMTAPSPVTLHIYTTTPPTMTTLPSPVMAQPLSLAPIAPAQSPGPRPVPVPPPDTAAQPLLQPTSGGFMSVVPSPATRANAAMPTLVDVAAQDVRAAAAKDTLPTVPAVPPTP